MSSYGKYMVPDRHNRHRITQDLLQVSSSSIYYTLASPEPIDRVCVLFSSVDHRVETLTGPVLHPNLHYTCMSLVSTLGSV